MMKYLTPFKLLFREFHGYKIEILILFFANIGGKLEGRCSSLRLCPRGELGVKLLAVCLTSNKQFDSYRELEK